MGCWFGADAFASWFRDTEFRPSPETSFLAPLLAFFCRFF
jgi:hypothetical protein